MSEDKDTENEVEHTGKKAPPLHTQKLFRGDCLGVLSNKELVPPKSVDLIYLDPPEFNIHGRAEQVWRDDGGDVGPNHKDSLNEYLAWLCKRICACYKNLKDYGVIYLHCSPPISHKMRQALEWSNDCFVGEIVWVYKKGAGKKHDSIFCYAKNKTKEMRKWYKRNDVWEIPDVLSSERLYKTEKPIALMEKILETTTPEQKVLDPFCGGGTMLIAAEKMNCSWVGIDMSLLALEMTKNRLIECNREKVLEGYKKKRPNPDDHVTVVPMSDFKDYYFDKDGVLHKRRKFPGIILPGE